jgi:hypothetical protein
LLKWARTNHCPWNEWTCSHAAKKGNLDMLKWARANQCLCFTMTSITTIVLLIIINNMLNRIAVVVFLSVFALYTRQMKKDRGFSKAILCIARHLSLVKR